MILSQYCKEVVATGLVSLQVQLLFGVWYQWELKSRIGTLAAFKTVLQMVSLSHLHSVNGSGAGLLTFSQQYLFLLSSFLLHWPVAKCNSHTANCYLVQISILLASMQANCRTQSRSYSTGIWPNTSMPTQCPI